jgi:hypothetical protein
LSIGFDEEAVDGRLEVIERQGWAMQHKAIFRVSHKILWSLCIGFWLIVASPFALTFVVSSVSALPFIHPLSYFVRRDPTTCPGYYDHIDDALLVCIHHAGEAQSVWIGTILHLSALAREAEFFLAPLWLPLALWALVRLLRRARQFFLPAKRSPH